MAALQRSKETFRRSGSSGLVWDDRFSFLDGDQMNKEESGGERRELRASRSTGYPPSKTEKNCVSPNLEPKVSARGVVGVFKKSVSAGAVKLPKFANH